jgi:hypothetical protein
VALPGYDINDDLGFGDHTKLPKPLGVKTAQLMRIQSAGGAPFTVDDAHAPKFKGLLDDLEAAGYRVDPGQSGGYNPRNIAGTNKPSNHAFGKAIDINWTNNARGTQGNIPPELARSLAQKHGLRWGGDWKNPDPMHFEVAGPDEHSPHPHTHGPAQSTPQVASFAQRSPKPMAEEGGFFSNLMDWANTPIGEARRKTQPIRDRYADGEGNLSFTTEEFLAKYPGLNKPGIREQIPAMLETYRMGGDLNRAAIDERFTPQPATWGQGLGEALKLAGSVATARNSPQLGMQMAQGIGADWRERNGMREKMQLQSRLQQAQALTTASDAAIKDSMARIEAKRKQNALFRSAGMPIPNPEVEEGAGGGATVVPSGTTGVGGVSASPIPVERGTLPDVGAQPQAQPTQQQPQARTPIQGGAAATQPGDDLLRKSMVFSADKSTEELGKNFMEQYKLQQGSPTGQAAERAKVAESLGMKPGDQAYQSYVATGKMPREDQAMLTATDKKAIMEAEELALASSDSIRALKEATRIGTVQKDEKTGKDIRPDINTGYTASLRAKVSDNLPGWMVPNAVFGSPEAAANTINYDNLVTGQALSSLKSIFGAAPTEGERKILMELQASSNLSPEARKPILERAIAAAERRLSLYNERANQLRGGDYYKPKDGSKSDYKNVPRTSAPAAEGRTSGDNPYSSMSDDDIKRQLGIQ